MANGAKRYQADPARQGSRGIDPFSYAKGVGVPAAPTVPMPPAPGGRPPGPPTMYEPRVTPGEARMKGAVDQGKQLSQILGDWSDRMYKKEEYETKKSGYETGLSYGQQLPEGSEFKLRGGTTVYDEAFNKGARIAYQAEVQLDMRENLMKYELEHPEDVSLFDIKAKSYRETALSSIQDPETLAFATQKMNEYLLEHRGRILKAEYKNKKEWELDQYGQRIEAEQNDIAIAIDEGNWPLVANRVVGLHKVLEDGVDSHLIDQTQAAKLARAAREDTIIAIAKEQYEQELINGTGDLAYELFEKNLSHTVIRNNITGELRLIRNDEAWTYLDYQGDDKGQDWAIWEEGRSAGMGLEDAGGSTSLDPELHERIRKELWSMRSRDATLNAKDTKAAATALALQKKEVGFAVDSAVKSLDYGEVPDNLDKIDEQIKLLSEADPVFARGQEFKLTKARWGMPFVSAFKNLHLTGSGSQREILNQLQDVEAGLPEGHPWAEVFGAVNADWQIELRTKLEKIHNDTVSAINSGNGLERAVKDGVPGVEIAQLTGGTPQDFMDLLASRKESAAIAAQHYGVHSSKIPPFSPNEIADIKTQWDEVLSPDQKLQLVYGIVGGLDEDAGSFLRLLDKKSDSSWGFAGALLQETTDTNGTGAATAMDLIRGADMPKEIVDSLMPSNAVFNREVALLMGDAFEHVPDVAEDVFKAARHLYQWRSFVEKDYDGAANNLINEERMNEVMSDLTGGIVQMRWTGSAFGRDEQYNIIVPKRGMDGDDVEKWLQSITGEEIIAQGGTLEFDPDGGVLTPPNLVAELLRDGKMKLVPIFDGPGQPVEYYLQWHNQGYVSAPDGTPFKLEYNPGRIGVTKALTKKKGNMNPENLEAAVLDQIERNEVLQKELDDSGTGITAEDLYVPDPALLTDEQTKELEKQSLQVDDLSVDQQGAYHYLIRQGASHDQAMEGALTGTTNFTTLKRKGTKYPPYPGDTDDTPEWDPNSE